MAFVNPSRGMGIRPGNHVDGNGRCYHPYLTGWAGYFDVGARSDFVMCDCVALADRCAWGWGDIEIELGGFV